MEKTIKEIANSLGVDKQRVYRYIKKNCINEALQKNGVMYYDKAVQNKIKQEFSANEPLQESASNDAIIDVLLKQYDVLKNELEIKNKQLETKDLQIAELTKLLDQQQQLHLVEQQKALLLEDRTEKKGFWAKIFKSDKGDNS